MRKFVAIAVGVLGALGGTVGISSADPGPNGKNNHGLCTAYFNGSEQGRSNKRNAGPFTALETAADDGDPDTSPEVDVWNWCTDVANNPKGIGGQPEDPTTEGTEGNGNKGQGKG